MYQNTDKRLIYQIINMYLSGNMDEYTFCHNFYCSYDLELDHNTLNQEERKAFLELSTVAGRFSESEEDIKKYPGVYYTKAELKNKIIETKKQLATCFMEYSKDNNDTNS